MMSRVWLLGIFCVFSMSCTDDVVPGSTSGDDAFEDNESDGLESNGEQDVGDDEGESEESDNNDSDSEDKDNADEDEESEDDDEDDGSEKDDEGTLNNDEEDDGQSDDDTNDVESTDDDDEQDDADDTENDEDEEDEDENGDNEQDSESNDNNDDTENSTDGTDEEDDSESTDDQGTDDEQDSNTDDTGQDPEDDTEEDTETEEVVVNGDLSCEAQSLLQYLYDITGENTLSGQESMFSDGGWSGAVFPSSRDRYVYDRVGKYPAVYSSDFGDVATTNLHDRQTVVDNAILYWEQGSIIQLHYHMIQPDQPDGAGFEVMKTNGYSTQNIDQILTDGTDLNQTHMSRLDELADYLQQLKDRGIPVLWRPYHEMNGGWFWWGAQPRFADLWIQMWEFFKNTRGLDNLLWVFSVNHWAPNNGQDPQDYYPGHDYVDVVGVDIYIEYGHGYDQYIHDTLLEVGGGKPIAVTENGVMPNIPAIKDTQPAWVYWATWWGFEDQVVDGNNQNSDAFYSQVYGDPRVLTQDEVNLPSCN